MRTFYFTSIIEAAKFCNDEGIPSVLINVIRRNASGMATECEVSVPADLF